MREQIILQRKERDGLLAQSYINRNVSLNLSDSLDTKFIKLITGPRRAGKSTLALLMVKNKNFAYLNFDNQSLLDKWDEIICENAQIYLGGIWKTVGHSE